MKTDTGGLGVRMVDGKEISCPNQNEDYPPKGCFQDFWTLKIVSNQNYSKLPSDTSIT